MFTQKFRPFRFSEIFGQDFNVEVLKSVLKNPETSPRSFVFSGHYGTGKTSLARIFARALNCKVGGIEPCGACPVCKDSLVQTAFYQEFDSSVVGNKESIQDLKDDFFSASTACAWRVIVFDEFHLASRSAQSALLKVLEDMPSNLFIIFATTEPQLILNTILSRSVELRFDRVPSVEIKRSLNRIIAQEGILIEEEVLNLLIAMSKGHVRDAVKLLEVYSMIDDKGFYIKQLQSSECAVMEYFKVIKTGGNISPYITSICKFPLDFLRIDFYIVIKNLVFAFSGGEVDSIYKDEYKAISALYGADVFKVFSFSLSDWVSNSFDTDITLQTFLYFFAFKLRPSSTQKNELSGLLDRAKRGS